MGNEKIPRSLYKYYSSTTIESAILENTFKWELPCAENDPFEALASGWDKDAVKRAIKSEQTMDDIRNAIFQGKKAQEMISYITAFVSFSERGDNLLMWSHYGDKHTGACIEFDTVCLEREIDKIEPVTYADEFGAKRKEIPLPFEGESDYSPHYQNRVRRFLSSKAKEWEYEKEWRLIVPPMASCIKTKAINNKTIFVTDIPQGSVKRLIFGYNVPIAIRLAWAKQIQTFHPSCTFAEIEPDLNTYKLIIKPLEIDAIERRQSAS